MAGHAPQMNSDERWLEHWLNEASDLRVSLVMLLTAAAVIMAFYLLDQRFAV